MKRRSRSRCPRCHEKTMYSGNGLFVWIACPECGLVLGHRIRVKSTEVYHNVGEYFRVLADSGEISWPIEKAHDPDDQGNGDSRQPDWSAEESGEDDPKGAD